MVFVYGVGRYDLQGRGREKEGGSSGFDELGYGGRESEKDCFLFISWSFLQ